MLRQVLKLTSKYAGLRPAICFLLTYGARRTLWTQHCCKTLQQQTEKSTKDLNLEKRLKTIESIYVFSCKLNNYCLKENQNKSFVLKHLTYRQRSGKPQPVLSLVHSYQGILTAFLHASFCFQRSVKCALFLYSRSKFYVYSLWVALLSKYYGKFLWIVSQSKSHVKFLWIASLSKSHVKFLWVSP